MAEQFRLFRPDGWGGDSGIEIFCVFAYDVKSIGLNQKMPGLTFELK